MRSRRWPVLMLFGCILLVMLSVTTWATLERSVFAAGRELLPDRWFQATLADAYCGFLTFYAWLSWRERYWLARIGWFIAIMLLGNIAMAVYVLIEAIRLGSEFTVPKLLLGRRAEVEMTCS